MSSSWRIRACAVAALNIARAVCNHLLDLVYPETCVLCDAEHESGAWARRGATGPGLAWYDRPHMCAACEVLLVADVVTGVLPNSATPVYAGRRTGAELVSVLSRWKYHGIRGLAWPLAPLVSAAVAVAVDQEGAVDFLVPIALHSRRNRTRGFNQAAVLAHLAALAGSAPVRDDILVRKRSTGQQAQLDTQERREHNMRRAFTVCPVFEANTVPRVGLVDDLVTGGSTCEAAVEELTAAGWQVVWVAALGLAAATGAVPTDS